jgi:hypothetical protein
MRSIGAQIAGAGTFRLAVGSAAAFALVFAVAGRSASSLQAAGLAGGLLAATASGAAKRASP